MKNSSFIVRQIICLILGNLGQALAFDCFLAGNDIAAGGFGGLALVISTIIPLTSGIIVMLLSVPVFIWSYFVHGARYTLSALISTAMFSFFIDLLSFVPTLTDNKLLAAICGGFLYGVSAYAIVMGRVAGTGTDLLARLLVTKFRTISLGNMTLICDGIVIVLSMIVFGNFETGIYAVVAIAVTSYSLDKAIQGGNEACLFEIITDGDIDTLADAILTRMNRGLTMLPAVGMYERKERNMLMVVVSRREVYTLKDLLRELCPDAFVMMLPASEVMGEGFHEVDVTVPVKNIEDKE